ncbi:MAG TPA: hypothetical protein VNH11_01480 [Pirellulales bacterium]|nr:hypothetical protein [Pirellulales bacterium]
MLARQLPGHEGGQARRGDGVAVGKIAVDLQQLVLCEAGFLAAFQFAQLKARGRLLDQLAHHASAAL